MTDITKLLDDRADSYEQSGPSAQHTAALLREAKFEILRLREALKLARADAMAMVEEIDRELRHHVGSSGERQ